MTGVVGSAAAVADVVERIVGISNISKMVGPMAKGHNTTSNQHHPRNTMDHLSPNEDCGPEVVQGTISILCGNPNLLNFGPKSLQHFNFPP